MYTQRASTFDDNHMLDYSQHRCQCTPFEHALTSTSACHISSDANHAARRAAERERARRWQGLSFCFSVSLSPSVSLSVSRFLSFSLSRYVCMIVCMYVCMYVCLQRMYVCMYAISLVLSHCIASFSLSLFLSLPLSLSHTHTQTGVHSCARAHSLSLGRSLALYVSPFLFHAFSFTLSLFLPPSISSIFLFLCV